MHADRGCVSKESGGEPRFVTRQIGSETIIVPICGGVGELDAIYTLNEIGSRIWQLIDGPTPITRIAETLCSEYDVSLEEATNDVVEFLTSLKSKGLIGSE